MSRDDFSIPGYDAWKTRAPEDERGYWDDKGDSDDEVDEPEEDDDTHYVPCCFCGKPTTWDPIYNDLCSSCCRADNE